jgi:uncharacterized protein
MQHPGCARRAARLAKVADPDYALKFHLSTAEGNVFTGYGADFVRLGIVEYRENIVVTPEKIITGWAPRGFDTLAVEDFATLAELKPEVALLGTGATIRFPHPGLTRALTDARIGLEVMDTPAACRTFNILAAEGRRVAAAILFDPAP